MTDTTSLMGRSIPRVEDVRLLRGTGRYVDDLSMPEVLHAVFVRSPLAHGRLTGLELGAARQAPGVHAVFAYADLRDLFTCDRIPLALPAGAIKFDVDPFALVRDEVTYVGEPVALVIAASRRLAEDAAALVEVAIDPLPAVVDPRDGLDAASPKARLDTVGNLVARHVISYGDIDGAFARAAHRIADRFRLHKGGGHAMETRGLLARWDGFDETLTVWSGTQMPHRAKAVLVKTFGLGEHKVRVIAPDVGGGFGPKATFHPEELAIPAAAKKLGRPVKWIEDRRENFVATVGERDQDWDMEAAFDGEGRLLAIRGRLCHDHGAYTPYGVALPFNAATNLIGPYDLPAYHIDIDLCLTNLVPAVPTRGAGRPQGTFVMERLLDAMAEKLGIGRDEIRRRNLIPPSKMPFDIPVKQRDGAIMRYDSGDYPECQRRALAEIGFDDFETRRAKAAREGRHIGIGICNYVEATGRGPFESASVRIGSSGKVVVTTGATAQGQGTKTMLAQLVADVLKVQPDDIEVIAGDTAASPLGLGAFASRQALTAGNAAHVAATRVAEKTKQAAAVLLEAAVEDLEFAEGGVRVRGVPGLRKTLAEIGHALGGVPGFAMPGGMAPGLFAAVDYEPKGLVYTNGTHAVEAEVDLATGGIRLNRYVVVHDCGRMINPMMVEGQIVGAVAHGIGHTLFEHMVYDAEGQPQSVTYADYLLPTADVVPRIEVVHMESPSPLNALGVKGAAESGNIGAPAAIVAAVEDAVRPLRIRIRDLPVTPHRLLALIREAGG
jgi:aerobic carbon-monoxide dehydrogenase large subunit